MNVDDLTLEEFINMQDNSRNKWLKTAKGSSQTNAVRQFLAQYILEEMNYQYWITFTFGYKPYMEEVEDVLFLLYERFDTRLLKHIGGKDVLSSKERSEWIHIPEVDKNGLHYHSFLNLKVKPTIGRGYENEWDWCRVAIKQTLSKLQSKITTLRKYDKIDFRIYNRTIRNEENIKMVIYSLKQYRKNDFDRFLYTIISHLDWKPTPISQRKDATKIENLRSRPNKIYANSLESFIG